MIFVTFMKLFGNSLLVKFATASGILSLLPAIIFVVWGFVSPDVHLNPSAWWRWDWEGSDGPTVGSESWYMDEWHQGQPPAAKGSLLPSSSGSEAGHTDGYIDMHSKWNLQLLLSFTLWMNSGYLGLGALAAGVDNPKRTFPLIVVTLMPFVTCVVIAPFLVALSVDDDITHYEDGYFATVAEKVAGPWLKDLFLAGSLICLGAWAKTTHVVP